MDFLGLNRLKLNSKSCKATICNQQLSKSLTHKIISFYGQLVNSYLYKYDLFKNNLVYNYDKNSQIYSIGPNFIVKKWCNFRCCV